MKSDFAFVAERALAVHCPELLRQGPGAAELLPLLTRMGERLARRMAGALAPLLGGEAPLVSCLAVSEIDRQQLQQSIAKLAANSLFVVGQSKLPLLVSIGADPVMRIVDHAFGGKGEAPASMPDAFPMAAELMIGRLETLIGPHLAAAVAVTDGGAKGAVLPTITPLRRDGSLAQLAPFPDAERLAMLQLEVNDGAGKPWTITVAMPMATLARLFGYSDSSAGGDADAPAPRRRNASAIEAPFGEVPLSVSAIIVDMVLPFSAIAALAPGQVLPVNVARSVPLHVGDHCFANGAIGAIDERIAIKITRAF